MVVSLPVEETKCRGRLRGISLCCRGCVLLVSYGSLGQSAIRAVRASGSGCRCGCVIRTRIRPSGWCQSSEAQRGRSLPFPLVEASAPPGLLPSEVPSSLAGIFDAIRRGADVTEQRQASWWGVTRVQPGDSPGKQSAQLNQLLRASAKVMTSRARRVAYFATSPTCRSAALPLRALMCRSTGLGADSLCLRGPVGRDPCELSLGAAQSGAAPT